MGRFKVEAYDVEGLVRVIDNARWIDYRKLQEYLDNYEAYLKAQERAEPQSVPVCEKGVEQFAELIKHVLLCRSCRTFVRWTAEAHRDQFEPKKTAAATEQPAKTETTSA